MKKIYFFVAILLLNINLSITAQTYLEEDFETAYSTNSEDVPPVGWTQYVVGDANTLKIWKFNNRGERIVHAPIEGIFATFDSDWWKIIGGVEEDAAIESPVFDIGEAEELVLTFDHQFRYCCEGDAALVEVFDGFLWRTVFSSTDENIGYSDNPEESTVVSEKIDISDALQFSEGTAKIRFRYKGYRSYWWMIDNVKVYKPNDFDMALNTIEVNTEQDCYSNQEPITVTVTNDGEQPLVFAQNPLTITTTITGTKEQSFQTILNSGALASGNSRTVTVTESADFSAYGNYQLETQLNMEIDGNVTNDVVQQTIVHEASERLPLPLLDFPIADIFLQSSNEWKLGRGETHPIFLEKNDFRTDFFANNAEHSNGASAAIYLYREDDYNWLISSKISATAYTQLTFDMALTEYDTMDSLQLGPDDLIQVMISTDCGISFHPILTYDASTSISATGQSELIDLSPYQGQDIILAFYVTDGKIQEEEIAELFLDNISLRNVFPTDLALLEFANEAAIVCNTEYVFDTIVVKNVGRDVLDLEERGATVSVTYHHLESGHAAFIQDITLRDVVVPNEVKEFVIPRPGLDFTNGRYRIRAYISLEEDGDAFNDTLKMNEIHAIQTAPLPLVDFQSTIFMEDIGESFEGWKMVQGKKKEIGMLQNWNWVTGYFVDQLSHPNGRCANIPFFSVIVDSWLISPIFEVGDSTQLIYEMALTTFPNNLIPKLGSDDVIKVMVSSDCENNFFPIKTYDHTSNISNTGQIEMIDLSEFSGQDIQIAFYASDGEVVDAESSNFFLDNIFIGDEFPTSIPTVSTNIFDFSVFPNPSSTGRFTIGLPKELSQEHEGLQLRVYNTYGQLVFQQNIQHITTGTQKLPYSIDLSDFSKGLYVVELKSENFSERQKVLIK